jgi:hypothetical protein
MYLNATFIHCQPEFFWTNGKYVSIPYTRHLEKLVKSKPWTNDVLL